MATQSARRYASGTDVPAERSRVELERLLTAHGATGFVSGWDAGPREHRVMFRLGDRMFRLTVELPDPDETELRLTPAGRNRARTQVAEQVAAEVQRRWRSLLLLTKARFVAVEDGTCSVEEAFLSDVVLPDGSTAGLRKLLEAKDCFVRAALRTGSE